MKKINLQLFDESRAALLRNAIADYAEIDGTYELMGTGFTTLDESPNASTRVPRPPTSPATRRSSPMSPA